MRRAVLTAILVLTTFTSVFTEATPWKKAEAAVRASTAQVQYPTEEGTLDTVCTAWSVNEARSYFATASHCYTKERPMYIDGQPAEMLFIDYHYDVAVVQALGTKRPALAPRVDTVLAGTPIAAYGHAFGYVIPLLMAGLVANEAAHVNVGFAEYEGRVWVIANFPYIGGMSGGPVVDQDGRVVSMVQLGNDTIGLGLPVDELVMLIHKYWRP